MQFIDFARINCRVDQDTNISANIAPDPASIPRRPGRPKGLPKPPGSGRKKGVTNRATRDVKEAAQRFTAKAIATLADLLTNADPKVRGLAAREILDRGHGKPVSPTELSGPNGAPLNPPPIMTDIELAQLVTHVLIRGEVASSPMKSAKRVIEPSADPFVEQRAEQAAEQAAAQVPAIPDTSNDTSDRWREMEATAKERHDAPWRYQADEPDHPKVIQLNPRRR